MQPITCSPAFDHFLIDALGAGDGCFGEELARLTVRLSDGFWHADAGHFMAEIQRVSEGIFLVVDQGER